MTADGVELGVLDAAEASEREEAQLERGEAQLEREEVLLQKVDARWEREDARLEREEAKAETWRKYLWTLGSEPSHWYHE